MLGVRESTPQRTKRARVEQLGVRPRTRLSARSAERIQRWWRAAARMRCTVNATEERGTRGFLRFDGRDVRCPISQERVPAAASFKFVTAAGRVAGFDAAAFVSYLRATGRFVCPCSQEPLGAHVVRRIERAGVRCGAPNARGLLALFHSRATVARRVAESDHRVLAIESACQSVLAEMLEVCADDQLSQSQARRELDRGLLPEYRALCADFAYVKRDSCEAMLRADTEKLRRLAVVPGEDTHGLLYLVVAAVHDRLAYCEHEGRMSRAEERLDRLLAAAGVSQLSRMFVGAVGGAGGVGTGALGTGALGSAFGGVFGSGAAERSRGGDRSSGAPHLIGGARLVPGGVPGGPAAAESTHGLAGRAMSGAVNSFFNMLSPSVSLPVSVPVRVAGARERARLIGRDTRAGASDEEEE